MKTMRGRTQELGEARRRIAAVRMLFAYGLNSCKRLEELAPAAVRSGLYGIFDEAVTVHEQVFHNLRQTLPVLEMGAVAVAILDACDKGILTKEESLNLFDRVRRGDTNLASALEVIKANRRKVAKEGGDGG